jgi:rubrerythrin
MPVANVLRNGWRRFVNAFRAKDEGKQVLEGLCEQYCSETHDAVQFAAHARRMYYPQFRERLLRLAAEEWAHVYWLRDQILALGGDVPKPTVNLNIGQNSWECLLLDLEQEKRSCAELMTRAQTAVHVNPEIASGLLRMRAEEQRHHEEVREMWMKSEPNIPPVPKTQHPEMEQQKQLWFERQRSAWFARQRSEWETTDNPVPWTEWEGELENCWIVNELPSLELLWARHVAKEEIKSEERDAENAVRY